MSEVGDPPPVIQREEGEKAENSGKMKGKVDDDTEDISSDSDSDYSFKSAKVRNKGSTKTFTKIPFNYERLNSSSFQGAFVNLGKPPHFDGTGYTSWRHKMRVHLIVCVGVNIPDEDEPITQDQEFEIQRNMQAASIILGSLCQEEFDRVDGIDSAKQIWDTLQLSHEGTKKVHEGRIRALEGELNRFIIHENETPSEMYNRLTR